MVHNDLNSNNLTGYDNSTESMKWVLNSAQNNSQFDTGTPGVSTGVGLNTPGNVINVDSFLKNIGNHLSKNIVDSNPDYSVDSNNISFPLVKGAEMNSTHFDKFNKIDDKFNKIEGNYSGIINAYGDYTDKAVDYNTFLTPNVGQNGRRSEKDLSAIDWKAGFSGTIGNLHGNPQDLTNVIDRMALERGGLNSSQLLKQSYNLHTKKTPLGPIDFNGKVQTPTAIKVRKPYPISKPFGLDFNQKSEHYNAIDVASIGVSTPLFDQDNTKDYNYDAKYSKGFCNNNSLFNNDKICNDTNKFNSYSKYNAPSGI